MHLRDRQTGRQTERPLQYCELHDMQLHGENKLHKVAYSAKLGLTVITQRYSDA